MPLYDFRCDDCDNVFDVLAKAGVVVRCPGCESENTTRLWSPVSPPGRLEVRGRAARESNARRVEREAKRKAGEL